MLPLHFALIQVSPPDDNGWMSLGISVDVTLAAARSAAVVIAQVNSMMPRIPGHSFIHLDDVSVIVEQEEELLSAFDLPAYESASEIAGHNRQSDRGRCHPSAWPGRAFSTDCKGAGPRKPIWGFTRKY